MDPKRTASDGQNLKTEPLYRFSKPSLFYRIHSFTYLECLFINFHYVIDKYRIMCSSGAEKWEMAYSFEIKVINQLIEYYSVPIKLVNGLSFV